MQMTKSVHLSKKPPTTTAAPVRTSSPNSTASATDKSKKKKKPGPISKAEGDAEEAYAEDDAHHETASAAGNTAPCTAPVPPAALAKRKKKKKAKSKASVSSQGISELDEDSQALMQSSTPNSGSHWLVDTRNSAVANSKKDDEFWSSMSNSEERQKIREFWLGLGEEERRSLVKVEKDAVLRKMKEQQKNSCNCSVCGKKRTAIEDELEVLYDAYYEELEQYANHQQQTRFYSTADGALTGNNYEGGSPVSYEEGYDGQLDEDDDEEDDDDYSHAYDDDINSQSDQSDNLSEGEKSSYDEPSFPDRLSQNTAAGVDHFNFGNSLTVKGGILTVADDLLKNDGKKFLDMMERLAERRIQKEDEVMEQTDDYYDEIDEDDDEAYDEEEEEAGTDEQRMEEGRRMFQIFAARMFEQRVLAAYREKVARERQQRLIQELEEEDRLRQERELKKQKEKERKKDRKRQLKKQKEEERLAREAQRKAEEEAARAERERKLEEERRKREQERLKKEEERRQKEEERLRKEEEKRRRLKEERERAAEKERKRKEKEEQERREREEKERKEREERERKEREERERKEREEKARAAKRKAEEEQRRAKEKEEQERAEREKREAEAAAATTATKSDKSAKPIESSPAPQSTTASSVASPAVSSSSPMRPVDDAARQKALMDVLVGSSTQASAARAGSDVNPPNLDMPVPPHPLLPLNGLPHSLPIGPARLAGQTATSPTHPFAAIDRGVMPIGFGRLSSSFDAGSSSSSAAKVISRPGSHIAPIGQPPNGRRPSSNAGPIGSPVGSRANRVSSADESGSSSAIGSGKRPLMSADRSETTNSFFSNFLFGEPSRDAYQDQGMRSSRSRLDKTVERRFSLESSNLGWTNGWTASTALSDNVHGRLFGDVLADRSTTILERAKAAYAKLDEITQTKYYNPARFHSLAQLHRMMCDMYYDLQVDIRELYEVISSPFSGFECINNAHSGWLVRYEGLRGVGSPALGSISSSPSNVQPPSVPHLPSSPPGPLFANSMPPPPQMKGNTQLFGSMS